MKVASSSYIREAEHELFHSGFMSSLILMNRVIARIQNRWSASIYAGRFTHVIIYVGTGNNAGDALGWATALKLPTTLRRVGRLSQESREQLRLLEESLDELPEELPEHFDDDRILIIDGLLGSGTQEELRSIYLRFVEEIIELRARYPRSRVVSIDIPSGLDCTTGQPRPIAIRADITMSIGCVKEGLLTDSGTDYTGRIMTIPMPEIGFPKEGASVMDADMVRQMLPQRSYDTYKNKQGHVGIIAGSRGYIGAAELAATAAQAAGAGLVTLYCPEIIYPILAIRVPAEIMVKPLQSYQQVEEAGHDVLLIGPGMGQLVEEAAASLWHLIETAKCPVILDADALTTAANEGWMLPAHVLVTPHPGEMKRLMGPMTGTRAQWVHEFHTKHDASILLKGARSIIASKEKFYYNSTGGSYMANAGQGDALAGCIAALCAQGTELTDAAATGAWLCGTAAEHAHVLGGMAHAVTASQMIAELPRCMIR